MKNEYISGILIPYDDFLEDHILDSKIFVAKSENREVGFIGILDELLTVFYIKQEFFVHAGTVFEKAKKTFSFSEAFVPTADLSALSVLLEYEKEIAIQALHFSDSGLEVRKPEFGSEYISPAEDSDLEQVKKVGKDFQDNWQAPVT